MSNKNKLTLSNTLKRVFLKSGNDKPAIINSLKAGYSFDEIRKAIPSIISQPIAYKYIFGTPLPKSYALLRSGVYTNTYGLQEELNWNVISFLKFKNEINSFLKKRECFYDYVLRGDYLKAEEILSSINEISYSTWGIEVTFLLQEILGGLEKNKDFLSYINSQKLEPILALLAHFYSNKAEKKISFTRYTTLVSNFTLVFEKSLQEYFNLKLNFFDTDDFSNLGSILGIESKSSVFDRYLTFMLICQRILANPSNEEQQRIVFESIGHLANHIDDERLNQLLNLGKKDKFCIEKTLDSRILRAYDAYTLGDYASSLKASETLILEFPQDISIYKIYTKSLQFLNQPYRLVEHAGSFINEILEDIYHISSKSKNTTNSSARLLKNISLLQGSKFASSLFAYNKAAILNIEGAVYNKLEYFLVFPGNPKFSLYFEDSLVAGEYLGQLLKRFPDSPTIRLYAEFNDFLTHQEIGEFSDAEIPLYRVRFYKALAHFKIGEYDLSAQIFQELYDDNPPNAIFEDILVNLIECYSKLGALDRCLALFVDNYFKNNNIILRIDVESIQARIERSKFTNISPTILLPIFFYLTKKDNHIVNVALRVFLKNLGINRPSELEKDLSQVDNLHFRYLLKNICTPEILKYSVFFNSTKDVLGERLKILQLLNSLSKEVNEANKMEIMRISQNLAIIEGIREVDESKIFIDIKGLITYEFSGVRANFSRYIELSELIASKKNYLSLDLYRNRKYLADGFWQNENQAEKQEAQMSEDYRFELFKELFVEIVQLYLFSSKYGLDSYLSTRIRHGTLLGQFRSEFQNQRLITQKDKIKEEYFANSYWQEKLHVSDYEKDKIQGLLATFSSKIDNIANDLREHIIQIKTFNRNERGLFDFTYKTAELRFYYGKFFWETNNYNTFIESVFFLLTEKTKTNLGIIQEYISEHVKNEVVILLNELERDIKQTLFDIKEGQELLNSIINCRQRIVIELDKIADWFMIKENVVSDFSIDKVINTSIEITNKLATKNKLSYTHISQIGALIKGEYFIHFFDLLRIFLENASNYSDLPTEELKFDLQVEEKDDILEFTICNNLSEKTDIASLKDKFEKRKANLNSPDWDMGKIAKEVGGTGFYKAKNILSSHLKSAKNSFDFFVNQENEVEVKIFIDLKNLRA